MNAFPRLTVRHTSEHHIGQVYIPELNWLLMVGALVVVGMFETSAKIGNAYGELRGCGAAFRRWWWFTTGWRLDTQPPERPSLCPSAGPAVITVLLLGTSLPQLALKFTPPQAQPPAPRCCWAPS